MHLDSEKNLKQAFILIECVFAIALCAIAIGISLAFLSNLSKRAQVQDSEILNSENFSTSLKTALRTPQTTDIITLQIGDKIYELQSRTIRPNPAKPLTLRYFSPNSVRK